MTIKRSKRPSRPIGAGRPRKLGTPPSAIGGPSVILQLFKSIDLGDLAHAADLSLVANGDLQQVTDAINEAFSNYANATAMQIDDSPAGERRNWCAGLSRVAAELHGGLGHSEHSLFMEALSFDAYETLRKGWPADPQTPEARALRDALDGALSFALPDRYALSETQKGGADFDGNLPGLLGRLGPALRALVLVARAAEDAWAAELARGKGSKEHGRRYLMAILIPAFTRLFGHLPTAAPGSPGHRWFAAVMAQAGRIAGEQRRLSGAGNDLAEEQVRIAALQAVEAIAEHIAPLPYETKTKGTARLDHWIRQALAASGVQRAAATARSVSSTSSKTRETKAIIRK